AYEAVALAGHASSATGGKRALTPGLELPGVRLPDRVIDGIEQVLKILLHRLIEHLRCPKAAQRVRRRDAGMKGAHLMGQAVNVCHVQLARVDELAQQGFLRELHHFHRVLNGCALGVPTRSLGCAIDGYDPEVQLGCQAAIESEFFLAEEVPFGERREIDKSQIDGLFDLIRIWASQHYPRDVRLQDRDLGGWMLVYGAICKGLDQLVVRIHPHASSFSLSPGVMLAPSPQVIEVH